MAAFARFSFSARCESITSAGKPYLSVRGTSGSYQKAIPVTCESSVAATETANPVATSREMPTDRLATMSLIIIGPHLGRRGDAALISQIRMVEATAIAVFDLHQLCSIQSA